MSKKLGIIRWVYNQNINDDRKCFDKDIVFVKENKDFSYFDKRLKDNYNNFHKNKNNFDKIKYEQSWLEICYHKEYCKVWFDIDTFKLEYDTKTFQSLLTELFDNIDKIFGKEIDRKSWLVYYKKTNTQFIHSLRIINKDYKIKYKDNKNIVLLLKELVKDNVFVDNLDEAVYHSGRRIVLPYNTKPYSIKYSKEEYKEIFGDMYEPIDSMKHYFTDYNYNNKDKNTIQTTEPTEYLISLVVNTTHKFKLKLTQEQEELISNRDFGNGGLDSEYMKELKVDRPHKLLETDKYKIVDTLIENIDKIVFTKQHSSLWFKILHRLKDIDTPITEIHKFLKYSSENSNDKYTYENNIETYENLKHNEDINTYNSYNELSRILTKHNKDYFYFCDYVKCNVKNICKWISDKTGLDYEIMSELFKPIIDENITDTKKLKVKSKKHNFTYDFDSSNLYYKDKVYNYTIETEYWGNFKDYDDSMYDCVVESITENDTTGKPIIDSKTNKPKLNEEIEELVVEFIDRKNNRLLINIECGGGKSFYIGKRIIINRCNNHEVKHLSRKIEDSRNTGNNWSSVEDWCIDREDISGKRICMVSPNNSLNKKEYEELIKISNSWTNHLEIQETDKKLKQLTEEFSSGDFSNCMCGECEEEYKYDNCNCDWCSGKITCKYCMFDCLRNLKSKKKVLTNYCNMVVSLESIDKFVISKKSKCSITDNWKEDIFDKDNCCDCLILDEFNSLMSRFSVNQATFKDFDKSWKHFCNLVKNSKQILIMEADINEDLLDIFCRIGTNH